MQRSINYFESFRLSIKAFGWRIGIKRPIIVFGPIKTYSIGKIELHCPIKKGILTFGVNECELPYSYTILNNTGTIEVYGQTYINFGSKIHNQGIIIFKGNNTVSQGSSLDIRLRLEIGFSTELGFCTNITDTNHHFLIDVEKNIIKRRDGEIKIGAYNWIGSHSFLKKGCITPDYTIVASPNSMLDKDYSNIKPYSVLAGSPAKVIETSKIRRLFDFNKEAEIQKYFDQNPDKPYYQLPKDTTCPGEKMIFKQ